MIKEIFDNSGEKLREIVYKELVEKVGRIATKKGNYCIKIGLKKRNDMCYYNKWFS